MLGAELGVLKRCLWESSCATSVLLSIGHSTASAARNSRRIRFSLSRDNIVKNADLLSNKCGISSLGSYVLRCASGARHGFPILRAPTNADMINISKYRLRDSRIRLEETPKMNPSHVTPYLRNLFLATCIAVPTIAFGQTTATTDPVGFITLNVAGAPAQGGTQLSFKGLSLTRPVEYQGSAEGATATTLIDNQADWQDNQFNPPGATANTATHYVEIVRPAGQQSAVPGEGSTFSIVATSGAEKKITLAQELPAAVVSNPANSFKIRKHWTIGTVFGPNNEAGLKGGDSTSADQILIFNGTGYDTYYFYDDGVDRGWVDSQGTAAVNRPIYSEDGLLVKRRDASPVNVVLMGAVKTGATSVPVFSGTNILSNMYAAPMTLGSSGLRTGNPATGVQGGDSTSADQVLLYNGTGYSTYYFYDDGVDQGWIDAATGASASNVQIPVGASFIVKRRSQSGFNWVAPQHPATL